MSQPPAITLSTARALARRCFEAAQHRGAAVTIAITDAAGFLVLLERSDGASLASIAMAQAKARTAALYRASTKALYERVGAGQLVPPLPDLVAAPGGVPLLAGSQVVGAIGVAGSSGDNDEAIAQVAVAEM
jgi:uncharacterized protein GlcG (DUF336 family)